MTGIETAVLIIVVVIAGLAIVFRVLGRPRLGLWILGPIGLVVMLFGIRALITQKPPPFQMGHHVYKPGPVIKPGPVTKSGSVTTPGPVVSP